LSDDIQTVSSPPSVDCWATSDPVSGARATAVSRDWDPRFIAGMGQDQDMRMHIGLDDELIAQVDALSAPLVGDRVRC